MELKNMSKTFARWYDTFMSPLERKKFTRIRTELLKGAAGNVLELGSGTGVNFPFYKYAEKVTALEPSRYMIDQSISKLEAATIPIKTVHASAEELPFEDETFDTIVGTLVFCTIPHPELAIKEMKRVCKPEGKILLFEHVKMDNPSLAHLQEWLTPFWKKICDGCHLNRDTLNLLKEQELKVIKMKTFYKGLFIVVEVKK
jgi:ubiquinone/menaquinone biosynthesis C-methylase UbiE